MESLFLDQDTLASLPEDGDLTDLPTIQPTESQGEVTPVDTTTTEEHYSTSFVPNAAPSATERETIQHAIIRTATIITSHVAKHWRDYY